MVENSQENSKGLKEDALLRNGLIPDVVSYLLVMIGSSQETNETVISTQSQVIDKKTETLPTLLSKEQRDQLFKTDLEGTYWAYFGDFVYSEAAQEFASKIEYLNNTIRDYFYHNRLFSNKILEDLDIITTLIEQQKEILKQGNTKASSNNILTLIAALEKFRHYLKTNRLTSEENEVAVNNIRQSKSYEIYKNEERNRLIRETEVYKSFEEFISQRNFPNARTPYQREKQRNAMLIPVVNKIAQGKWPGDAKSLLAQYKSGKIRLQGALYREFIQYLQSQNKPS